MPLDGDTGSETAVSTVRELPLIAITGRRYLASSFNGPELEMTMAGLRVDGFYSSYAEKLGALGAMPVFVTRESDPAGLTGCIDGLVLAGGLDVDPRLYGSKPTAHSTLLDPEQDEFEIALTREAVERGIPILGTCRGHELLNVAFGGTLREHLEGESGPHHRRIVYPMVDRGHRVEIVEGSAMHELYGSSAEVNSFHHQAIDRVGDGIRAIASAEDDDVIEAIELEGGDAIGVQWHPEFSPEIEPVLRWLVERARARSTGIARRSGV